MKEIKKLSKMQKILLKEIGKGYSTYSIGLSKCVSRMIDGARIKIDRRKYWAEEDKQYGEPSPSIKYRRLVSKHVLDFQTDSFRSSFSRSLKRLMDRGLIKKDIRNSKKYTLTIKGTEAFEELFGMHPDDYKPC